MKIYKVKVNGKVYEVELESVSENNEKITSEVKAPVEVKNTAPVQTVSNGSGTPLKAPMQGTILKVNATVGQAVKKGQVLIVLEAMKLENDVVSPCDGVVSQVKVSKGQTVNNQEVLLIVG